VRFSYIEETLGSSDMPACVRP